MWSRCCAARAASRWVGGYIGWREGIERGGGSMNSEQRGMVVPDAAGMAGGRRGGLPLPCPAHQCRCTASKLLCARGQLFAPDHAALPPPPCLSDKQALPAVPVSARCPLTTTTTPTPTPHPPPTHPPHTHPPSHHRPAMWRAACAWQSGSATVPSPARCPPPPPPPPSPPLPLPPPPPPAAARRSTAPAMEVTACRVGVAPRRSLQGRQQQGGPQGAPQLQQQQPPARTS
jgi:hypothetical protein